MKPDRLREFIERAFDKAEKRLGSQTSMLAALGITDKTLRNWKKSPPQQLQVFVELLELAEFWDSPVAAELPAELPADITAAIERRASEIADERVVKIMRQLLVGTPAAATEIDPASHALYSRITQVSKKGLTQAGQSAVQPKPAQRRKKDAGEKVS